MTAEQYLDELLNMTIVQPMLMQLCQRVIADLATCEALSVKMAESAAKEQARVEKAEAERDALAISIGVERALGKHAEAQVLDLEARVASLTADVTQLHEAAVETEDKMDALKASGDARREAWERAKEAVNGQCDCTMRQRESGHQATCWYPDWQSACDDLDAALSASPPSPGRGTTDYVAAVKGWPSPGPVKLWICETCNYSGSEDWAWAHYEVTKHSRYSPLTPTGGDAKEAGRG